MRITPLGDSALLVEVDAASPDEAATQARRLARLLVAAPLAGVHDVVSAFGTVTVYYTPSAALGEALAETVEAWVREQALRAPTQSAEQGREVEIPVCYGGEAGPDLADIAARAGLSTDEVIALHSEARYVVRAVGFTPGFPYLAGLPERLHTPRLATPRVRVPAGSVGIGGTQTGIYPLETPGGWNLIGRTPLTLFDAAARPPARLQVGDTVRFRPVSAPEFEALTRASCHVIRDKGSDSISGEDPEVRHVIRDKRLGCEVVRPGMLTTVQDGGRLGWQAQGVPVGGAMDRWALRVGNLLVGNAPDAAVLECTLRGPTLRFAREAVVAVTGATVGGLPAWQPFPVREGETLSLENLTAGCRAYLAVAGGIAVPPVLGSCATYVPAGLGGVDGRALRAGDELLFGEPRVQAVSAGWRLSPSIVPVWAPEIVVCVIPGVQADWFSDEARETLFGTAYRVAPQSDRMGLRLQGGELRLHAPREMRSEGVSAGAIQVPPNGQPIVLTADCQTLGGYPKIAHVISIDLPKLAQARPGDVVRFAEVTLAEAQRLCWERERELGILQAGLYQRHGLS